MAFTIPKSWFRLDNGFYFDSFAGVMMVPRSRCYPDPNQPRKYFDPEKLSTLRADIKAWRAKGRGPGGTGILVPLLGRWEEGAVKADGSILKNARIILVDGERRWRVTEDPYDDPFLPLVLDNLGAKEARDAALRTALHDEALQPIEEAHAFQSKMDEMGWGQRPVARFYNVSPGYVEKRLNVLKMGEDVKELVGTNKKVLSSAAVIDKVKHKPMRESLIEDVRNGASFQEVKDRAEPFIGRDQKPKKQTIAAMPRIEVAAYLKSMVANATEVRNALKAAPQPKAFYRANIAQHTKALRALLDEIDASDH